MPKILVSACLLGENCRYNGQSQPAVALPEGEIIPFCPEVAGGLPTPRPAAEIVGGDGADVWRAQARVINDAGIDVSAEYMAGACAALLLCQQEGITQAILKARSPSCGCKAIYDGTRQGVLRPGVGVTAALLKQHGISIQEV